jgi:hypothetical protein
MENGIYRALLSKLWVNIAQKSRNSFTSISKPLLRKELAFKKRPISTDTQWKRNLELLNQSKKIERNINLRGCPFKISNASAHEKIVKLSFSSYRRTPQPNIRE